MERIWENIEQIIQSKYQLKGDEWVQVSVSKRGKIHVTVVSDSNIKRTDIKKLLEEELDKRLSDIRQNLLSGLQSRLRSIDITDISKRTEVIENIKYQIANLQNAAISDFDVIASFITDLKLDVRDVGNRVVEAYKGQADALTDEELVALNKNYFAFYCEQAKDIYNSLVNMNTYKQIVGEANYNKLMTELQLCKSILDQSYDAVKRMQVVNAQRIMLKEGIKVNSPTIYNYISENTRKTDFDISYITRVLGSGDRINDEAIKSLFNILQKKLMN